MFLQFHNSRVLYAKSSTPITALLWLNLNCIYFKDFRGLKIISKIVHCGVVGEEVEDEEEEETIAVLAVVAAVVLAEELKMLQGFLK